MLTNLILAMYERLTPMTQNCRSSIATVLRFRYVLLIGKMPSTEIGAADKIQLPLAFMSPLTVTNDEVYQWQSFIAPTTSIYETVYLMPLGLYVRTNITGRDPSQWKTTGWVYNNIFYPSLDDLHTAIKDPKFEKLPGTSDQEWAHHQSP